MLQLIVGLSVNTFALLNFLGIGLSLLLGELSKVSLWKHRDHGPDYTHASTVYWRLSFFRQLLQRALKALTAPEKETGCVFAPLPCICPFCPL